MTFLVPRAARLAFIILASAFAASCGNDEREVSETGREAEPAQAQSETERVPAIAQVPFSPGGTAPVREKSEGMRAMINDPEQIAAGRQLYLAMNCVGCHAHGGGGMGPALIDDTWIYGGEIENIAASIREGRPAGMPSFRGFLPEEQIWQISAYVHSLPAAAEQASR